jgi:hypothetical protein
VGSPPRSADRAMTGRHRQQLIAAQRKIRGRVRWTPWERFTMGLAAHLAPAWRTSVLLVQPATILRCAATLITRNREHHMLFPVESGGAW